MPRRTPRRHDWVVYAKTPLAGPAAVLDYLSRYTHRTAIGNERLVAIRGNQDLICVRADQQAGPRSHADAAGDTHRRKRIVAIGGVEFIRRFLQHVLPCGFKRIRHYGLLARAAKTQRLALARQPLAMPAANPLAREQAQDFMRRVAHLEINRYAHCGTGRWRVIEQLPADPAGLRKSLPSACRGPP